jgi:hypothetical protein
VCDDEDTTIERLEGLDECSQGLAIEIVYTESDIRARIKNKLPSNVLVGSSKHMT